MHALAPVKLPWPERMLVHASGRCAKSQWHVNVTVHVNKLLAISMYDYDNSG